MSAVYARPMVVGLDLPSVDRIGEALDRGEPIGLVHDRLPAGERDALIARLRAAAIPEDTAAVVFTTGSTGRPKGVVLSTAAMAAAVRASARLLGVRDGDRWLLALPPAHVAGLGVIARSRAMGVMPIVAETAAATAAATATAATTAGATAAAAVSLASLVPSQLVALLEDERWRPSERLRGVLVGGAAATAALIGRARARGVPVLTTYGMSETFGQVATSPPGEVPPAGAVGKALDGVAIAAGTRAEPAPILVTTASAFSGYLDEARPAGEQVVTSDLGFVEDGWLYVVGRADDVIITGGEKVHPVAIEAALARVPGVASVCIVGVPDERWGQLVAAALVVASGFDGGALDAAIAALAPHARPRRIAMVESLPLGPTGKIDRRAVAAGFRAAV